MNANVWFLVNVALAFYFVGTMASADFQKLQAVHWHKRPYRVFAPLALAVIGSITLI